MSAALRVGGLTPLTSLDYPDHLACVVFTQGCPLRCGYCHNPHLLDRQAAAEAPSWNQVLDFLQRRQQLLEAVVFSGGEPTQQAALVDAVAQVRALGFQVALHTAGLYPQRLSTLLPHLSWVGLDIKATPERYPIICGRPRVAAQVVNSLEQLLIWERPFEVRLTLHPKDYTLAQVGDLLDWLRRYPIPHLVLQIARGGSCLRPEYQQITTPFSTAELNQLIKDSAHHWPRLSLRT